MSVMRIALHHGRPRHHAGQGRNVNHLSSFVIVVVITTTTAATTTTPRVSDAAYKRLP